MKEEYKSRINKITRLLVGILIILLSMHMIAAACKFLVYMWPQK